MSLKPNRVIFLPGRIMFEVGGVDKATAHAALTIASHKLPIKTKIVQRPDLES